MKTLLMAMFALCTACAAPQPPSVSVSSHRAPINGMQDIAKPQAQAATSQARASTEITVFRGLDPHHYKGS